MGCYSYIFKMIVMQKKTQNDKMKEKNARFHSGVFPSVSIGINLKISPL